MAAKATHINGLDVQAAADTIAAIKADKTLAKFQFRAKNVWINGGENRSTIRDFYGAGREDKSRSKAFEFINGEPPSCSATTRERTPSSFCSTRSPAASPRPSSCMPWHAGSHSMSFQPYSKAISICRVSSVSMTPYRQATNRSASVCTLRRTVRMRSSTTCWPTLSSTPPCAIPCVGRSQLRSNESSRDQNAQLPAVNSDVRGAIVHVR